MCVLCVCVCFADAFLIYFRMNADAKSNPSVLCIHIRGVCARTNPFCEMILTVEYIFHHFLFACYFAYILARNYNNSNTMLVKFLPRFRSFVKDFMGISSSLWNFRMENKEEKEEK